MVIPWAVNPDCLRFLPYKADRHHRNLTSTTACWLISRSIIIGHFHLRTCLPQTGCTPVVSLGSLDAIFFTPVRLVQECHCAPVTAPEMVNVSGLLDMAGRTHRDLVLLSERILRYPLRHLSKYHERISGRDHPSEILSSHKVLTQNHVLSLNKSKIL